MMTVLEQLHLCMIKKFHVAQVLHRLRNIYFCSKYLRCFQSLHNDVEQSFARAHMQSHELNIRKPQYACNSQLSFLKSIHSTHDKFVRVSFPVKPFID